MSVPHKYVPGPSNLSGLASCSGMNKHKQSLGHMFFVFFKWRNFDDHAFLSASSRTMTTVSKQMLNSAMGFLPGKLTAPCCRRCPSALNMNVNGTMPTAKSISAIQPWEMCARSLAPSQHVFMMCTGISPDTWLPNLVTVSIIRISRHTSILWCPSSKPRNIFQAFFMMPQ